MAITSSATGTNAPRLLMAGVLSATTATLLLLLLGVAVIPPTAAQDQDDAVPLPFLNDIPPTSFTCLGRNFGFYADVEANCQVFHICSGTSKWSMLCPNQTMFNQQFLVCDYPVNVDCPAAANFYAINERIGIPDAKLIDDK